MKNLSNAIGVFFLSRRQNSGQSLEEVSALTGFPVSKLDDLEKGRTGTSWPMCDLNALAKHFDASMEFGHLFITESFNLKPDPKGDQ